MYHVPDDVRRMQQWLEELLPNRFPPGRAPECALDPVEVYELASRLAARIRAREAEAATARR